MEVRTIEARPLSERPVRAAATVHLRERSASKGPFTAIADTAARALEAPIGCLYVSEGGDAEESCCYGTGAENLWTFIESVAPNGRLPEGPVSCPESTSSYSIGGDGVALTCYVAVPVFSHGKARGLLCVADFRDRSFGRREISLLESFATVVEAELAQRHEEQRVRESEQRYQALTENSVDLVGIVDENGIFSHVSAAAATMLARRPCDLVGCSIYDHVPEDDLPALRKAFTAAERLPGHAVDVEYRYVRSSGGIRQLRLRIRNLFERQGIGGFVICLRDVTDRFEFEAEILKSRDRAEEMSRLKSVFLTNMSHEIRTPLTTILGFAEILADEVDEEQREFVQLIHQGGERLMDTLMSILDLARLESSSFDITFEPFDITRKIWEICHLMEPLAQEKGIRLDVTAPIEPVEVVLDISAVERAVSALLSNGIKFTKDGSVSVSLEADEEHVLIHVADTGIGISTEFMPFLFEEFKQESEGLSRMHEGSGLGLSITKRLVELMKGDIMAESEKGQGTVFTVALPRNGEAALKSTDGNGNGGEIRPRVLVVEDNADTRTLVNHLLRKNYEVVCASDGDEALSLAAEKNYDVLLVDINLGKGKSGEDVLHAVKSLPTYESTPVIAVTAYAMPGDRERFFSEGFDDYVSKPFSKQRLLEALEAVLE